jgi:hypothetical protein
MEEEAVRGLGGAHTKLLHSGPPPPIKGRKVEGVQNQISTVDLSASISVAQTCVVQF